MGIFDRFKTRKDKADDPILQIAALLSNQDPVVVAEMEHCLRHPKDYGATHIDRYQQRGIDPAEEAADTLCWIGLVDTLCENGYVTELDWKAEKQDFIFQLMGLKTTAHFGVEVDEAMLDGGEDIPSWCTKLDQAWEPKGICLLAFDIDSDSYCIFVAQSEWAKKLPPLAQSAGRRIDFAKGM